MIFSYFIAKGVASAKGKSFSRLIIRIAVVAVALSMTVMIVASSLIAGFKKEIRNKVFGFWGHIHIVDFEATRSYESVPVSTKQDFYPHIDTFPYFNYAREVNDEIVQRRTKGGVKHIQTFAVKAGVIKTDDEIEGLIFKGVGKDFNWTFLNQYIKQGKAIDTQSEKTSRDLLLSEQTANRLKLKLGDDVMVYFVKDEKQLRRKFTLTGIYRTGLEEYDLRFGITDIRVIQRLYGWEEDQVSGFEIFIDHLGDMEPITSEIYANLPMHLYSTNVKRSNPEIFGWLELQNLNEIVIMILMIIVCIINMATALVILILDRTNMIGTLKAMGSTNWQIQQIFLYYGAYITGLGILVGNVVGIGLCLLQKYFQFITLNEADYYVSVAPIEFNFGTILLLNLGTIALTLLVLIVPTFLVQTISPIKAIRFK